MKSDFNIGDVVKLHDSKRRNGDYAGKIGLVVDIDPYENPVINIEGEIKDFHYTQIAEVINV